MLDNQLNDVPGELRKHVWEAGEFVFSEIRNFVHNININAETCLKNIIISTRSLYMSTISTYY